MSAVNRSTKGAPRTRTARKPRLGVVTVAWAVSRDAANEAWPVQAGDGEVELRWVLDLDARACRVVVIDGARETVLTDGACSAETCDDLLHIEAKAGEDEFAATLRETRLLYARTSILTRAGIQGGRYEVVR